MVWATELANGPKYAMGLAKRAFNRATLGHLEQALDYEAPLQGVSCRGGEFKEGVQAFLEKRKPQFNQDKFGDREVIRSAASQGYR